jgi:thiamine biosynthesis lipoprotein
MMQVKYSKLIIAIPLFAMMLLTSCNGNKKVSKSAFAFDTVITISIYDRDISNDKKNSLIESAIKICNELDDKFSSTKENSEIYQYNNNDKELSKETLDLIDKTKYFTDLSSGLFDCYIGRLVKLWNVKERKTIPQPYEINEAKDSSEKHLDFGAVIKGYACDKISSYFKEEGVKSAIINLGGNVTCIGGKSNVSGFSIGIEKPFSQNEVIKVLDIVDKSVVTSGIYQRYFTIEGDDKIYHHIIDPFTGYPTDNNLYSVSIVSNSSILCDMLSTTLMLMNPSREDLIKIIKKINDDFDDDITVIIVDNEYEVLEFNYKSTL